jgi:hypothetical protein
MRDSVGRKSSFIEVKCKGDAGIIKVRQTQQLSAYSIAEKSVLNMICSYNRKAGTFWRGQGQLKKPANIVHQSNYIDGFNRRVSIKAVLSSTFGGAG